MNQLLAKNKNAVLCHSMGNKLFEGIATQLTQQAKIDKIIFAAADLNLNDFQNGALFNKFTTRDILVLVNQKDQTLKLSKFIHRKERIGLNGLNQQLFQEIQMSNQVEIWDVTQAVKEGKLGAGHIYFKRTESIFNRIKEKLETE